MARKEKREQKLGGLQLSPRTFTNPGECLRFLIFGQSTGDIVAIVDYDGDGKAVPAGFRPTFVTWFIARTTAGTLIVQFGANGDRPIPIAFTP